MGKQHRQKRRVMAREDVGGLAVREIRAGYWQVDFQRAGKRYRKAFKTLEEAKAHAAAMKQDVVNNGVEVLNLSPRQRLDAMEALRRLQGSGVGILDAVDYYLRRNPKTGGETIRQTCDKYLDAMRAAGRRPLSIYEKELKFNALCESFGESFTVALDEATLEQWAESRRVGKSTTEAYIGAGRDLLLFFQRGGRLKTRGNNDEKPPVTWDVETVRTVMQAAENVAPEIVPAFAVLFFAGIRPHEVFRLTWKQIDLDAGVIRLTGEETKTRTMRNVDIADNLRSWLTTYRGGGMLAPNRTQFRHRQEKTLAAAEIDGWPVDVARHTFATMHYNTHQNAAATMAQLGHFGNPATFLRHYKGVPVTAADAAAYWKIEPTKAKGKGKILRFRAA